MTRCSVADGIVVRPFEDRDLPAVLDVMRAALGEPPGLGRTPELFGWKHVDNPFGRSLMLVAQESGRIAGFRAFMRWELVAPDGTTLRCVRAVDTATHPDFQRRGIFRQLTLAGIDLAIDDGIDLIFNTPNEKSGAGYLTMGWSRVGAIGVMARPCLGLISFGRQDWPEPGDAAAEAAIGAGRLDGFPNGHLKGLHTLRTREYLQWRFAAHPTGIYVVGGSDDGVAVARLNTRNGRRELVVSELAGPDASTGVRGLIRRFRPDYAAAWFSEGSMERRLALRSGLVPVPKVSALALVARPLRPISVDVTELASWDLSLGDLELL